METNDLAAKNFETYPDVAADIINVLIYEGEQRTNKDSLLASPTETVYQGRENLRNQLEDVARYEMHDGRVMMLYLFANQTRRDPKMIFRKAGYIGGAYREQYDGKVNANFASPVCVFRLNRCEHIASPVYGYGSSV